MIVDESNDHCYYDDNGWILDCDCSKGIESVFKPLVFTTRTSNDETLDLVIQPKDFVYTELDEFGSI